MKRRSEKKASLLYDFLDGQSQEYYTSFTDKKCRSMTTVTFTTGDAELQDIRVEDGLCTVQLSREFYTTEQDLARKARLIIGAFVNSLCYLSPVEEVTNCVGDKPISSYGSYLTQWPMRFDSNLLS